MTDPHGRTDSHQQHPTLAEFKKLRERSAKRRKRVPLVPVERGCTLPLSYAQERLWFLDQLGLVGPAYNAQMALRLQGQMDLEALERSFSELIRRHESLRTHFESVAGTPVQVIDSPKLFALELRDLSGLQELDKALHVQELSSLEAHHPFSLSKGPLLRAALLKLAEKEYVLLVTAHHIVTDGWSWGVIQREIGELYGCYFQGQPSSLPELPVQYVDYAVWQRRSLQGEVLQSQLQYWRERLIGAPSELQLPTDRPRHSVASYTGARLSFEVRGSIIGELERLARREGTTLFMALLGAYQVLLSRCCGQQDVVVGTPVAGRTHAQSEGMVGFFVNTLVMRTDLSGNPSFRQVLERVKEVALGAYAHQDLPFEKLVMELRPERNLTRQPIIQVVLAMQNYPQEQMRLSGLTWTKINTEHAMALFDLTLHLVEVPGGLHGEFVYATDLFDLETIERLAGHFRVLLEAIVSDPDCPIERLPLLTATERTQVLHTFNDTATAYPQDRLIHELFEERVQSSPDAVAVVYGRQALTYGELNSKANQLAHYLVEQGVQVGEYIPILMQRSLQMLIAQLALLKSGAVYVPVDPSMPIERAVFMIRDCGARRVLAEHGVYVPLGEERIQWIDCSEVAGAIAVLSKRNLNLRMDSRPPAYVMYTSGSTGVPKGVVVAHRAVNRLVINNSYAQLEPSDCIAHCSNPAFDASTFEIWGAFLNGARVLIVPQSVVLDAPRFADELREHSVTVLWMTVGLLAQYAQVLASVFKQLRYLLTGGDIVDPGLLRRVLSSSPPRYLLNAYGPTECTTFSTTYLLETVDDATKSIPIGRPISNTQIYLLDRHLAPVPIGLTGEIYIGGAGVACGYLNRPELTAERFITDPFSTDSDARLYKSGDLGRWRADGNIEFLGRNDQQVKLRGFRIELGEVEAQLARHYQVKDAVVIAREDVAGGKRLVAYITRRDEGEPTVEDLREHLEAVLPEYMVPSAFVILESLPLTQNGKVDRRALPRPSIGAHASQVYEAPEGEVEEKLAAIWQELLQVERVGRRDNFFDLGGHSLLVLKVLFKINQACGCALSVRDVYGSPTLHELAIRIYGGKADDDFVDLRKEAALDNEIVATRGLRPSPAQAVMLTGGTGFVGRFLLTQLLQDTDSIIYCLVRAPSEHRALFRLRATLAKWDMWREEYGPRIVAIPCDLRLPQLGIDEITYQVLSRNIDTIYHCGTSMNHLETYEMAKAANVESTRELLKLATTVKPKLINYVSTLSVFSSREPGTARVIDEASPTDHERHLRSSGYAASKWVAEKIFITASERGVPCNIFRLGLIWADTEQGRYDELQRDYRILKSCLLSGYGIKDYRYGMDPTPVNYAARAVSFLGNRHHDGRRIFHISSSSQMTDGVFERCNEIANTSLQLLPLYTWICEIKRLHQNGRSLPVVPLIEFVFSMDEQSFYEHQRRIRSAQARFDCARTQRELEHAGIVAPALNDDHLRLCVECMFSRDAELQGFIDSKPNLMSTKSKASVRLNG